MLRLSYSGYHHPVWVLKIQFDNNLLSRVKCGPLGWAPILQEETRSPGMSLGCDNTCLYPKSDKIMVHSCLYVIMSERMGKGPLENVEYYPFSESIDLYRFFSFFLSFTPNGSLFVSWLAWICIYIYICIWPRCRIWSFKFQVRWMCKRDVHGYSRLCCVHELCYLQCVCVIDGSKLLPPSFQYEIQ